MIVRAKAQITGLPQDLACPPSSLCAATAHHAPGSSAGQMSAHPMGADTSYIRPAPASKPQAASQKYGLSNDNSDLAFFFISARISKEKTILRRNEARKWTTPM